jgi:hypothetical protein
MLDKQGRLSVTSTQRLLKLMANRDAVFEENMRQLSAEDQQYFGNARTELEKFLKQAIALNEPIDCSF